VGPKTSAFFGVREVRRTAYIRIVKLSDISVSKDRENEDKSYST